MNIVRLTSFALLLWGLAGVVVACQTRQSKTESQVASSSAQPVYTEAGQQAYLANCAVCHGEWGEGDGPLAPDLVKFSAVAPAQLNNVARLQELGRDQLVSIITLGGGGTHRSNLMPPWGNRLKSEVIGEIADYVMALPSLKPGIPRATIEKYLQAEPGTPAEGRKLFVFYCTMCHGPYGEGNGFLADSLWARYNVRPRDLTDSLYFANKSDQEMYVTIAHGGGYTRHSFVMPAWSVTLAPDKIKDLVSYVRSISRTKSRP